VCKLLFAEETISYHGECFSFDEVVFEPKPVQRPRPPILVGGESKAALRRAARWEDLGVTRMIVSPWRRSREAIDGLRRFADLAL
jgi:alkanesulfonate monooxygenase SsuD/methylene tetrahydromethanopterin reductase-like flavin-dependent oxidoreductase (luciferase family)